MCTPKDIYENIQSSFIIARQLETNQYLSTIECINRSIQLITIKWRGDRPWLYLSNRNKCHEIMLGKRNGQKYIFTVQFYLYKTQKLTKLIHGEGISENR